MNDKKTIFIDGMFINVPREEAPDFVDRELMIYPQQMIEFLMAHKHFEKLPVQILKKKDGTGLYATVNTYYLEKMEESRQNNNGVFSDNTDIEIDDIPL